MVGGGAGAMIGAAHPHAMWLDNQYVLAAGVFTRDQQASVDFARSIGVARVYDDYWQMAEHESARGDGVDIVAVVTPNDTHYEITTAFLERGISVVCEKPLTNDASLEWRHEDPQHLIVRDAAGGETILAQGMSTLSDDAARLTRVGLGHPEGFLEAFANFYLELAEILRGQSTGDLSIPAGVDGLIGVRFVEAAVASNAKDTAWVTME